MANHFQLKLNSVSHLSMQQREFKNVSRQRFGCIFMKGLGTSSYFFRVARTVNLPGRFATKGWKRSFAPEGKFLTLCFTHFTEVRVRKINPRFFKNLTKTQEKLFSVPT